MKALFFRYKPQIYFFIIFTVAFFIVKYFFLYFLPFIIGLTVSFMMYPVYKFMKKRLLFKSSFSATVITLFIFSIVIAILLFVGYLLISQSLNLYHNNIEFFNRYIKGIRFPDLISDISFSTDMVSKLSDTAFSIVRIIPISITLIIISFVSTVCIINRLSDIKKLISSKLSEGNSKLFEVFVLNSKSIFKKYIRSYLFLYTLTFIESIFIFTLIDLDYVIVFAFLAAVSDLLPILGPGAVYLPIAVAKFISGEYLACITLAICWAIVVIIRQIIEPKIVSDTIKIHPLVILSALYFSIVSSNIWLFFYITFITVLYKILIESDVLKPVFFTNIKENIKGG